MKYILLDHQEEEKFWSEEENKKKICSKKFSQNNQLYFKGVLWKFSKKLLEMEQFTFTIAKNRFSYYKVIDQLYANNSLGQFGKETYYVE
jgi:hypothetical protein